MELIAMIYYRVEEGDTFEGIAQKFHGRKSVGGITFTGLSKLISLNTEFMEGGSRNMDVIYAGELLRIQ